MPSSATLFAEKQFANKQGTRNRTIAALTLSAALAVGATLISVDSASASEGVPVSGPILTPTQSPSPTASASPSPSPTATTTGTPTTTAPAPAKPAKPAKKRVTRHERVMRERARVMRKHEHRVHRVLREAKRQKGKPYVYGADGPQAFDCSGLVRYVFLHALHRSLPHNAAAQYYAVKHIKRSQLMPGDLIFTDDGYISHVGIFAGHHRWWVAPHTGTRVQLQRIYSAHFLYGRVIPLRMPKTHRSRHHRKA